MKRLAIVLAMVLALQSVLPVSAMEAGVYTQAEVTSVSEQNGEETITEEPETEEPETEEPETEEPATEEPETEEPETEEPETEEPETEEPETEEPETEEPETEEPETEEPETEEPETEEPETEEPETEEPEAEESESEELISEKDILENDAESTLYGQEDYSEIISIYEKEAETLTTYVQDAYYFSQGSVSLILGAQIAEASISNSSTTVSDVYYAVGDHIYSVGTLNSNKAYYDSYYKTMTMVIDSFQVEADPGQSQDFKVYFTFDGTKYIMTGSAKFIDETKNSTRVYHFEEPEYFNPNKGSKIQLCSSSLTGYSSKDKIKKVELVSYETNKVVATGKISYNYISTSPATDRRYKSSFTDSDGKYVNLSYSIFPKDTYSVYVCSDFTLPANLAEGYYDLLYTAENGVKYREMNRYYGTQESHVYSVVNNPSNGMYPGILYQDQCDYVSVYVYGININQTNIPVFYNEGTRISNYDTADSHCGYEYRDEWGSCFVVKKTQSWKHGESYNVSIDNATMHTVEDSMQYWDRDVYLLEKTDSYIRAYIPANTGIQEGTELTWVHSNNRWSSALAEEAVTVKKNEFGLYVEVGSKSTIFAEGGDYYVDLKKSGETVVSGQFYSETIPTIKPVSKITVPSGCTFEIHPINQVAQVLYSGKSTSGTTGVLTNAQMVELSKKGSFRVCIYNGDGTLKDRYLACSTVKEAEKYPIAYELNGGVNDKENPEFYSKGDAFTLKAPSKEYANFAGWYSDANLTIAMPGIKATDSGAKTFYAKWKPYTYTIKFDANGGTGTMKDFGCSYGASSVLPANSFTKKGYNFVGWSTVQNPVEEAGTGYENQAQVLNLVDIDKGSITLYAQWEIADYRIIYHTAGGVNDPENVKSYTVEDEVTFLEPTATLDGISFAGWYRENTYRTPVSGIAKGSTGDIHVYARWVPNTYTVAFDVNAPADAAVSGTMANVKASYHADVTLPKNKLKCKGYTFAGWSTEKAEVNGAVGYADMASINNLVEPQNNNDGKVTLYAVWKNQYDIVYHVDGGSLDEYTEGYFTTYQYGDVKALPVPVKTGYTFGGWYKDEKLKSKLSSITKTTQGDFDLYAKWTANNYKITFSGNGSTSGKMATQTMKYGVETKLSKNKFVRNGYKFVGWKTADGVYSYEDGDTVTDFVPAKNNDTLNLEAQWEAVDYQITYMPDGGKFAEGYNEPHQYTFGTEVSLPGAADISREGYTFGGWYTDSNYKKKITGITAKTVGDLTLYAKWTASYTVVFHADDDKAVGTMKPLSMKYDAAKALTKNKFTLKKANSFGEVVTYGFTGWSLEPKGEVIYQNGEKIVRPNGLMKDENGKLVLHLYAVWDLFYKVTFIYPDGFLFGEADSVELFYNYGTGIPKSDFATILPKKDGYTFAGWYSDPACKKRVTAISGKQTGDMVLYAKWTGVKYTVAFDANSDGVKGKMSNQKLTYGTEKALSKCAYKRTGYTFKGWSTEQDGEVVFINQAKISTPARDADNVVKLYAVWEKDTYSITYRNMRAGETVGYPESYQVDSDEIVLEEPERIGYTFLGWYADAKYKKKIEKIQTGSTGDLTLYAKWKIN